MGEGYLLYTGCLIPARLPYLEASSRLVLDKLGIEFEPFPSGTCCVEPIGLRSLGYDAWMTVVARMLSVAEVKGKDVLTLCNGCFMSFKEAAHQLEDQELREKVNERLAPIGRSYGGGVRVKHVLEILEEFGSSRMESMVTAPQSRLRIALHPGCHIIRPSKVLRVDSPYSPRVLADIALRSGAEVVDNEEWPRCCGGGLAGVDDRISNAILQENVDSFRRAGANCILTPCPFCFVQFDLRQKSGLPVLYLSELVALAFGATADEIGLKYHRIKLDI
ncbi:MAG: CoB--CoM heterodisulfide reductase iron-sulfur subunit B family protein [Methanomassiliicoccales archaeon]|nr:CoB--CoM heterodisulfide reductase iron-sulfur subunit B family protein [Methanomassiliicoccales archaeon]